MFWDSLCHRYSDPMTLLSHYIRTGRMCEFIEEFIDIVNRERNEEKNWEYFLHKVFDKSYNDFLKEIEHAEPAEPEEVDMEQVETTVKNSMKILESFNLEL